MVELKIRKFGNSLGVVLPKEVINRLRNPKNPCGSRCATCLLSTTASWRFTGAPADYAIAVCWSPRWLGRDTITPIPYQRKSSRWLPFTQPELSAITLLSTVTRGPGLWSVFFSSKSTDSVSPRARQTRLGLSWVLRQARWMRLHIQPGWKGMSGASVRRGASPAVSTLVSFICVSFDQR
jgi:hypothetical protein